VNGFAEYSDGILARIDDIMDVWKMEEVWKIE
jgi:hypothetical protein